VLDDPITSDEQYDTLYQKIVSYEQKHKNEIHPNSPTQRVGGEILDSFSKASHMLKMYSQEDIFNQDELKEWLARISKSFDASFVCEPKLDGISLNIIYENGLLKQAITRGNGEIGEDVTQNAKAIKSIPLSIDYKELIEIRGEVVILKKDFELLNEERLSNNEPLFANPRNGAAGSMRQLDTNITAKRKLMFYPWGVGHNTFKSDSFYEQMDFIFKMGFLEPPFRTRANSIDEIMSHYNNIIDNRASIDMVLDGMMIKVDSIKMQKSLGYTVKNPRFSVAFKFEAVEKLSRVNSVVFQVGRTGVITPVANIEPVLIEGAMIERVTLHNFDEVFRKDIKINDEVLVVRSGDVIPKIVKVLSSNRSGNEISIIKPDNCPVCDSKLYEDGALLKCQNIFCDARVVNSIIHFSSKKGLNIDGFGKKIIKLFCEKKIISSVEDIFLLHTKRDDILSLEGFKEKKVDNLLQAIENAKECSLDAFIYALGIEHIGEVASKRIAQMFGLGFVDISKDKLEEIDSFGSAMVDSFYDNISTNRQKILSLLNIVSPKEVDKIEIKDNPLLNKSVVITGTFERPRDILKKELENLGAKTMSAISKKTDFLLCGQKAGSKKDKAQKLGVEVIEIDYLNKLLK